jgi:phosphatidate cytidylyltransferase
VTNLATRSLVAAVGIPLLLWAAYTGGLVFFLLVLTITLIALSEFHRLAEAKGVFPNKIITFACGVVIPLIFLHEERLLSLAELFQRVGIVIPLPTFAQSLVIVLLLAGTFAVVAEIFRNRPSPIFNLGTTFLGIMYVPISLGCLVGLRMIFQPAEFPLSDHFDMHDFSSRALVRGQVDTWGGLTVCAVFVTIWLCDSAAYFAGRGFGRHKLIPRVSPNKTWEGAVAGFLAAVGGFLLVAEFLLPYLSVRHAMVTGCIVGVFGQLGDLAESLLKRDAGVKDSASLIPGHGGMLDRFDSLILVSPVLFLYYDFVVFAK